MRASINHVVALVCLAGTLWSPPSASGLQPVSSYVLSTSAIWGQAGGQSRNSTFPVPRGIPVDPNKAKVAPARTASKGILRAARVSLADGNVRRASQLVAEAKRQGITGGLNQDSPKKVQSLIDQATYFQSNRKQVNSNQHARDFSRFLMEQADGLIRYNDLNAAEKLTRTAANMNARFSNYERTPAKLLREIAIQRTTLQRKAGNRTPGTGQPATFAAKGGNPSNQIPTRLPQVGSAADKPKARQLVARARLALDKGQVGEAEQLIRQAQALNIPEELFGPGESKPWQVALEIGRARRQTDSRVSNAGGIGARPGPSSVRRGLFSPTNDRSRNIAAQATQPVVRGNQGQTLYREGMQALKKQDRATALSKFKQAWRFEKQLDKRTRQELKIKLTQLQSVPNPIRAGKSSPLESVDAEQRIQRQRMFREILAEQKEAREVSENNPLGAMEKLRTLRERVKQARLAGPDQKEMLGLVDRNIRELDKYIERNRALIDARERNQAVQESVANDRKRVVEIQNTLAAMVDKFNSLIDERRFSEAEVIAKQARELDPKNPVVQTLVWKARFIKRMQEQLAIKDSKEQAFYQLMTDVEKTSASPVSDEFPIVFGSAKKWRELTRSRRQYLMDQRARLAPAEIEIQQQLKTKVQVNFENRPLTEVLDTLSNLSGVPIFVDLPGLQAEGLTSSEPVTLRLRQEISLKSALNLILEPLRLNYVIKNEVLKVTSEQTKESQVFARVYDVADLVIPIPNFMPSYNNFGLAAAMHQAHSAARSGLGAIQPAGVAPLTLANKGQGNNSVLAQTGSFGMSRGKGRGSSGYGSGGLNGPGGPDFDTLIELVTTTIEPQSWSEVGGNGNIEGFPSNLSLVISTTEEVHQQIADLLRQLRRLQDLQVTIEVRFINLSDNFFERVGIDFDFEIDDNSGQTPIQLTNIDDSGPSIAIGLAPDGQPTLDLDMTFLQESFGASVPAFGGFDAATAANFGFAILSDIEVFFLLQAASGDQRSNIMQAPKVTLFNGQLAFIADQRAQPFVTGIEPVVGDFAAAHRPIVAVLTEGTSLSVQAVVSADKRFVRLTLVPMFSRIGPVQEFTFDGSTTTNSGTTVFDPTGNPIQDNVQTTTQGTTVQLPQQSFTTVSTTVSVPDGGTILLGGIKRLSEARAERGVPLLSKIPYINRLFKNVGIGRETSSLMLMVTPRIIIQEEEEEKLGINTEEE